MIKLTTNEKLNKYIQNRQPLSDFWNNISDQDELSQTINDLTEEDCMVMYRYGIDFNIQALLAQHGKILHTLKYSHNNQVKIEVIMYVVQNMTDENIQLVSYYTRDENPLIRELLAYVSLCLDTLTYDDDANVRRAVALQEHNLDILKNDPSSYVTDVITKYDIDYQVDAIITRHSEILRKLTNK